MCDNCCDPFIEGEGCSSALQKKASNVASGDYSIATGHGTIASNEGELSTGTYNKSNQGQLFSVGIGTSDSNRMNAIQVNKDGSTSFLYNGQLVKLTELIHNVSPSDQIVLDVQDGYIVVSYNGGASYTNLIALSELKGEPGSGVTSVNSIVGENTGGDPSVTTSFVNGVLTFTFNNLGNGGTATNIPLAASNTRGGIKVGRAVAGKQYPVEIDGDERAYVYVPWTGGSGSIEPATPTNLGGIKTGFTTNDTNRVYAVELTEQAKAYVHVPWSPSEGGTPGGHTETIFTTTSTDTEPNLPANQSVIDDEQGTWRHFVNDSEIVGNYYVWMAVRWCPGVGQPDNWEGPWCISGNDGNAGADGKSLEFIYRLTTSENAPSQPQSSGTGTVNGVPTAYANTIDDWVPQNWTDSPTGIDATNKYEWMCFRVKSGGHGGEGGTWSAFTSPVLWSAYGKTGTDGDGIEYIFYAGLSYPTENPATWNKNTTGANSKQWGDRDFIKDGFDAVWLDNPIDLDTQNIPDGTKQWVCIRKKYADNAANRSNYTNSTNVGDPYWHAFSSPALWGYKAKDGLPGSGIVADLDNEMIAVPLDSNGDVLEITQSTNAILYSSGSPISSTVSLISIVDTDSPVTTYDNHDDFNNGNGYLVTINGNQVTITLKDGDVNLAGKNLLVNLRLTSTADNSVYGNVALTLVGVHFGDDGSSYRLGLNCRCIRHTEGVINPAYIEPRCIKTTGLEPGASYTPAPSSLNVLNGLVDKQFCFKYEIDDSGTLVDLNSAQLSTNSIQDNIRILLYYGDNPSNLATLLLVDQETLYVISDGITPSARYKSVVFKRSLLQPNTPNTGIVASGSDADDGRGITNANYGGTFVDPIPYGWSDGVPAYDDNASAVANTLWMTTRVFVESPTNTYQTVWTTPQRATDTSEYDIEFAYEQPNDDFPMTPEDGVNGNRHGCSPSSNQVWFDPVDDSSEDFTQMVWRAERYTRNGIQEDWVITRIAGETGAAGLGIQSMVTVYGISNSASTIPGDQSWVSNITGLNPQGGDWVWSKTTVTYTDNTTDVFYTKYRQVSDGANGTDGTFTAVPFRGVYQNGVNYYGNTTRTDIVYHRGSGKYYRANPLAPTNGTGYFSNIEPSVTYGWNNYWLEFGTSYDNIGTGMLLAENANIANFIFRNGKLFSSYEDGEGQAYLILDGTNGKIFAMDATIRGEINALSGSIGALNIDHGGLSGTFADSTTIISTVYDLENKVNIDENKIEFSSKSTGRSSGNVMASGTMTIGMESSNMSGGFVDIDCTKRSEIVASSDVPRFECGLKVTAENAANAIEANGNVFVDGTLAGRKSIVSNDSRVDDHISSTVTLTYKNSGCIIDAYDDMTINISGTSTLNRPGFNFRIIRSSLSATVAVSITSTPSKWYIIHGGQISEQTTAQYTLPSADSYEIIYVGKMTVSNTEYNKMLIVY